MSKEQEAAQPQRSEREIHKGAFGAFYEPSAPPAASSEPPQEWTAKDGVIYLHLDDGGTVGWPMRYMAHAVELVDAHNAALAASTGAAEEFFRTNGFLTNQLAAEREKFLQMDEAHVTAEKELASRLLQAQAAIEEHNRNAIDTDECLCPIEGIDATALREHDAALLKVELEKSDADCAEAMRQLREQDDFAVRVAVKPLVEALKKARIKVVSLSPSDFKLQWLDEIDAALAQVKETSGTNMA